MGKVKIVRRDAKTGKFTTKIAVKKHPSTTETERRKVTKPTTKRRSK